MAVNDDAVEIIATGKIYKAPVSVMLQQEPSVSTTDVGLLHGHVVTAKKDVSAVRCKLRLCDLEEVL
jgi:hypothetical protein